MGLEEKTIPWYENIDGTLQYSRRGPEVHLSVVELPWAILTEKSAVELKGFQKLKKLSLKGRHFAMRQIKVGDLDLLSGTSELESLSFNGASLDADLLSSIFLNLTNLEEIDVRGLAITPQVLSTIVTSCPHLRGLSVGWAKEGNDHSFAPYDLGAAVLAETSHLENLSALSVRGLSIADADIEVQHSFSRLRDIDVADTNITSAGLNALGMHGGLERIVMDNCPIDDDCAPTLEANSDLHTLSAEGSRISDPTLGVLSNLSRLAYLNVSSTPVTDVGLAQLAGLPNLRVLKAAGVEFSASAVADCVIQTPSLRSLYMGKKVFSAADLPNLETLDELELGVYPDQSVLNTLATLDAQIDLTMFGSPAGNFKMPPRLRELRLDTQMSRDIIRSIAPLRYLRSLSFRGNAQFLAELNDGDLPGLRNLLSPSSNLDDTTLARLAQLPSLESLYISDNPISEAGITTLVGNPYLHTLELRAISLSTNIIEKLLTLPSLHCLDIPGTGLPPSSVAQLGAAPTLQSLAIDQSQLAKEAVEGLASLPTLMELYLYGDGYTKESLKLLKHLPFLNEIVLVDRTQPIAVDEVSAFFDIQHLRHINGPIEPEARKALAKERPEIYVNGLSSRPAGNKSGRNSLATF
ncbi:hypothetical protein [Sphingorhabdus sp. Alg231-15]|uniref:hypothetical protein n=1 Tax=Sphingorhabdus sp. Alg231-15 TaxID=1922222 RepID=UPI00307CB7AC